MKVFNDLKKVMLLARNAYLSVPLNERNNFLNNFRSHELFKQIIEKLTKIDYKIVGAQHENDPKFFSSRDIDYSNLLHDKDHYVDIGVFFIPKGLYLPTHDHPNMLVISKVLSGTIQMVSMDEKARVKEGDEIEVDIKQNALFHKGDIDVLTPDHNNYHYILAKENTIFLDLFLPHYDDVNRICNQYEFEEKDDKLFLIKNKDI